MSNVYSQDKAISEQITKSKTIFNAKTTKLKLFNTIIGTYFQFMHSVYK
jgi:hypothetical protein